MPTGLSRATGSSGSTPASCSAFYSRAGPYAQLAAKATLELLTIHLCTQFEPKNFNTLPEDLERRAIARRLLEYVEEHYTSKLTLEDLADYAQYNRTYVSTLFKQIVGINFHEYLTRVRFQHALNDLAITNDNLTDIALRNGFARPQNLQRPVPRHAAAHTG